VLPRYWLVERTFGGMTRPRRLVEGDAGQTDVSAAMIFFVMIFVVTRG
jgi:hypothetical protein